MDKLFFVIFISIFVFFNALGAQDLQVIDVIEQQKKDSKNKKTSSTSSTSKKKDSKITESSTNPPPSSTAKMGVNPNTESKITKSSTNPSTKEEITPKDSKKIESKNLENLDSKITESKKENTELSLTTQLENKLDSKDSKNLENLDSKITESKPQPKTDSKISKKQNPPQNIRDFRDDFHIDDKHKSDNVDITQKPQTTQESQDSSLEIVNDDTNESIYVQKHESEVSERANLNPLFSTLRVRVGVGYHTLLGLGDTQTLIFNAGYVDTEIPLKIKSFALNVYGAALLGKADSSMQAGSLKNEYFSAMGGAALSMPFQNNEVVQSHGIFVGEYGIGMRDNAINEINSYVGIDFVYNDFVFRPYLGADMYFSKISNDLFSGIVGYLGFSVYYSYKNIRPSLSVSWWQDFLRDDSGVFTILPISNKAMYLGGKASSFEFDFGIDMFSSKHFMIKGAANVRYTYTYYNINAGIKISASFRF